MYGMRSLCSEVSEEGYPYGSKIIGSAGFLLLQAVTCKKKVPGPGAALGLSDSGIHFTVTFCFHKFGMDFLPVKC